MKKLLAILCLLVTFVACSDDDDNTPTSPIDGLKLPSLETTFTTGQAVTIEGKGFNQNSQIWLRAATKAEGDIQAEITEVNENSITFTVPENVDGQKDIILKQDGKEYTLGKLTFKAKKVEGQSLYAYRTNNKYMKIVKIDINTGGEEDFVNLDISLTHRISPVYIPSKNEIIGIADNKLLKVNLATKQVKFINLEGQGKYLNLITDNHDNLYAFKIDVTASNNKVSEIVKIDFNTGKEEEFTSLDIINSGNFDTPLFVESTNEIFVILYNCTLKIENNEKEVINGLLKINLDTGIKNYFDLDQNQKYKYSGLVMNDEGYLFSGKYFYSTTSDENNFQIIKINLATEKEEIFSTIDIGDSDFDSPIFLPSTKEIIGLINDPENRLLKINTKGECNFVKLSNNDTDKIEYGNLLLIQK